MNVNITTNIIASYTSKNARFKSESINPICNNFTKYDYLFILVYSLYNNQ